MTRQTNIPSSGSVLHEEGKLIAVKVKRENFAASNSWLGKWKVQRDVKQFLKTGEDDGVRPASLNSWAERLPEILKGYELCERSRTFLMLMK